MLPHDFPPFESVKTYFYKLQQDATWKQVNDHLRHQVRQEVGREAKASLLIIDSQSVKTTEKGGRDYNGGKKIKERKRHIVVDTQGWLVRVLVHPANWGTH